MREEVYVKSKKGYSLIEAVFVLGIVGILMGLGGYNWLLKILMPSHHIETIKFKAIADRLSPALCNDWENDIFYEDCFYFGKNGCFGGTELIIKKCLDHHLRQMNYDEAKAEVCIQADYLRYLYGLKRKNGKKCQIVYKALALGLDRHHPSNDEEFYDLLKK